MIKAVVCIALGASLGALIRWFLGVKLNHYFPTIPLGTLAANIIGAYLMGIAMISAIEHSSISKEALLGITTGFLGSLTTFSTFSGETAHLLINREYLLGSCQVAAHVLGSVTATMLGMLTARFLYHLGGR